MIRLRNAGLATAVISAALASLPATARGNLQSDMQLDSALFVERATPSSRTLEKASRLSPGDRVVTVLTWRRNASGTATLTNPLPRGLYYQGSANDDEDVSVDGGRTWGKLGALRIGNRMATPEDVTHVRWRIAGATGRITYSAIVR